VRAQTVLAIHILLLGAALAQGQTGIWMGAGPTPHSGIIQDAPFSADLVSINDQVNGAPGLKTEFHGKVGRDAQGDTYYAMEHMMPVADGPRPVRVIITHPAALTVTTLDPQSKTAFVSHVTAAMIGTVPLLTPGNVPATADGKPGAAVAQGTENATVEQLGTKEMNGLQVVGVRKTHTTPAHNANGKPFVSTVETWTSPELKIVVMMQTQTSNGDRHLTKLENLVGSEPNAALFQVPAGYSVRDNVPLANNMQ